LYKISHSIVVGKYQDGLLFQQNKKSGLKTKADVNCGRQASHCDSAFIIYISLRLLTNVIIFHQVVYIFKDLSVQSGVGFINCIHISVKNIVFTFMIFMIKNK
jgi:hypothetical protein